MNKVTKEWKGEYLFRGDAITCQPTMQLRLVSRRYDGGVVSHTLQQLWLSSDGTTNWEDIDIVSADEADPE